VVWLVGWTATWLWVIPPGAPAAGLLIFPDGRLPGPRWRPVAWIVGLWSATIAVLAALDAGGLQLRRALRRRPAAGTGDAGLHAALLVVFARFPSSWPR
jgi:hypothetical protein